MENLILQIRQDYYFVLVSIIVIIILYFYIIQYKDIFTFNLGNNNII